MSADEYDDVTATVYATNVDDEIAATAVLSVDPAVISEDGGTATVRATLSPPQSVATTVTVTPVAGAYTVETRQPPVGSG